MTQASPNIEDLLIPFLGTKLPKMSIPAAVKHSARNPGKAPTGAALSTTIADALFTATQQRVLALLFGEPDRSFYTSELIDRIGAGSGAVQRELKRLAESGLVTVKRIGNQKHYQANPDSPVYAELCSLVRKTVGLAGPIRKALEPLADRVRFATIYGSVAKGVDTAASDIDLLIVADRVTLEDVYRVLAPVEETLGRKINPTLYTSKEFEDRKASCNPFLSRVLSGEHIVLMGAENG